jgi:ThiF family
VQTVPDNRTGVFRITAADRQKLEALLYKRYPNREWGTFFRFGYRITSWGIHVCFVDALEPHDGDLDQNSGIVEFDARYILRAQLRLESSDLGIGMIHSHPQDCATGASFLDKDMDEYFSREFSLYSKGRPYVSIRVARDSDDGFAFNGEAWIDSEIIPIVDFFTVGTELQHHVARGFINGHAPVLDETRARLFALIGRHAGRLQAATVGVVGCSGLGSPAVHILVRAGVRKFVLVDPGPFAPSNLERMHGSVWSDLQSKPSKIEILSRFIRTIEPDAQVMAVANNVLDDSVLDKLLKCDLVLGCTDTQHSRAALGDFANHYLLPCLDAAVLMRGKDARLVEQVGEIARYSADEPCPWCLGRINQRILAYELMTHEERQQRARAANQALRRGIDGEQYWGDAPPREATVGYMTTTVAAMQAGYAQNWITGASTMPHQRFQFDLGMPLLGVVPAERARRPECSCNRAKGWSDQARADRSVTRPAHWN